jgi:hypothetical protein
LTFKELKYEEGKMKPFGHRKNGNKEVEHPKPQVEFLENSLEIAQGLAAKYGLTLDRAIGLLTFNEIRCLHYHIEVIQQFVEPKKEEKVGTG